MGDFSFLSLNHVFGGFAVRAFPVADARPGPERKQRLVPAFAVRAFPCGTRLPGFALASYAVALFSLEAKKVEAAGVEPASQVNSPAATTCLVQVKLSAAG